MLRNSNPSVLIVGAGPTGLTAAMELKRFGICVRIIDELVAPAITSRAVGIQARTLEELELRGLAAEMVRLGHKASGGRVYAGGKRLFRLDFSRIESRYNYLLLLSQAETERILRDALVQQGIKVERGIKLTSLDQDSTGVKATLQHSDGSIEEVRCAYLIDAEGAHSKIRSGFHIPFKGKTFDETFVLGDLRVSGDLTEADFHIFSSEFGFMALFPMGGDRFRVVASHPLSTPSQATIPSLAELQTIYNQRSHIPAQFSDLAWSSWFQVNSRMVEHLKVGRVFLAGDAAHIHSPAGAQGMNSGIQDMMNLGWKLAMVLMGVASETLLDTYEQDRIPVTRSILKGTEALTDLIDTENHVVRSIFNHVACWLAESHVVQEKSTSRISQIALGYRDSPLSENHMAPGSLRAGDRIPDLKLAVTDDTGAVEARRLINLLDPSRFTLLLVNIGDAASRYWEVSRSLDRWRELVHTVQVTSLESEDKDHFREYFGADFSLVLIRPDAYIGFRGTEHSLRNLTRYCNRWLQPAVRHRAA
jgi:2-polyprenyl-6-methoxyphenol hydroxylase-like FAD-dependent oxidoreductase